MFRIHEYYSNKGFRKSFVCKLNLIEHKVPDELIIGF